MLQKNKFQNKWRFWIDRGGTFTDIIGYDLLGNLRTFKVPSGNDYYSISPVFEMIRQVIGLKPSELLTCKNIEEIRLGTTLGTNALLERKGSKTAFLVTKGFEDVLCISHQTRSSLFSLSINDRPLLYTSCHGVNERMDSNGSIITSLDSNAINNNGLAME